MRNQNLERAGFGPPARRDRVLKHRRLAFAQLIATVALVFSILVAVTAVSFGIARAATRSTGDFAAPTAGGPGQNTEKPEAVFGKDRPRSKS